MIGIKEYFIKESVTADSVLSSINNVLNKYLKGKSFDISINEIFGNNKERQQNTAYGFDSSDELLADIAGYLIEIFVWNKLKNELFDDDDFIDVWNSDVSNLNIGSQNAKNKMQPLVRRKNKGKYWDFELPGVDGYFEIKSRLIDKNGKSGGFRYSINQTNDKNLNYILVKYKISDKAITIDSIEVKKK